MSLDLATHKKIEEYKGYDICYYDNYRRGTDYYYIGKNLEPISSIALASIRACKNVIDTHLRNKQQPIYK